MNVVARRFSWLLLVVVLALVAWFYLSRGVPAPPDSLADNSPVAEFLRYGDSLRFATEPPGATTIVRTVGGAQSTLRVRGEVRLTKTKGSAYTRGRIIERWETTGAPSRFGVPISVGYLWVKKNASGGFDGTLFYRASDGTTGQTRVSQKHVMAGVTRILKAAVLHETECFPSNNPDNPDEICCLCGPMHYNCSGPTNPTSLNRSESVKTALLPKQD